MKLTTIENCFKSSAAEPSIQLKRFLSSMSTKRGMKELFEGTQEELEQARRVIKHCLTYTCTQLTKQVKNAIETKQFDLQRESDFLKSILDFIKMFC